MRRIAFVLIASLLAPAAHAATTTIASQAPAASRANASPIGVPTIMSPFPAVSCLVPASGGGSSPAIGITLDLAMKDHDCVRLSYMRFLADTGFKLEAIQMACLNSEVRQSFARAGRPCEEYTHAAFDPQLTGSARPSR